MPRVEERSPAKINLSLKILGKRDDGYHELRSLVVFARDAADHITLDTNEPETISVSGPFASKLDGENILSKTLERVRTAAFGPVALGAVHLTKSLPVAAGIGGGSANAAALLRAIGRANPGLSLDWHGIAKSLGADVPVCLESRATIMTGIGDLLSPLREPLPSLAALLVNPNATVPPDKTARVFRALNAPKLLNPPPAHGLTPSLTRDAILRLMAEDGNDLSGPAVTVVPEIADVLALLKSCPSAIATALSGAGPTAFALFDSVESADEAAAALRLKRPQWWVAVTRLM